MLGAKAHAKVRSVENDIPANRTRLRPTRSAMIPEGITPMMIPIVEATASWLT